MSSGLTQKQKKFIEFYEGNGTKAARQAGYTGDDNTLAQTAFDLLRNPKIKEAIDLRLDELLSATIANRKQRQEFWTKLMNDEGQDPRVRLKASELLGKSEADFIGKSVLQDEGNSLEDILAASWDKSLSK